MIKIGMEDVFEIYFEKDNLDFNKLVLKVYNKDITSYYYQNKLTCFSGNVSSLIEWFQNNLETILTNESFPLPVKANSSYDFYLKCMKYDSEDIDELTEWFEKYQAWEWGHSWYICRENSYLASVYFRKVENQIEIEWDNTKTYNEVEFVNPKGKEYIDINIFIDVIQQFIQFR